jgi:murein DD-endopeptidase MepM/ murein hydrolase activator NlpD
MQRILITLIFIFFFIFFLNFVKPLSLNSIEIYPNVLKPGDILKIFLKKNSNKIPLKVKFRNKYYPFYKVNSRYRALIGIPVNTKSGYYKIKIIFKDKKEILKNIKVKHFKFPVQRIKLSKKKRKLYTHPNVKDEYKKIKNALRVETKKQYWDGNFILPSKGRISTLFGMQRIINNRKGSNHKGIDISYGYGKPVKASNNGVVVLCDNFLMHGKTVVINHGQGICSLYLHFKKIKVYVGQKVSKGDIIGEIGSTGVATGPHLHFGLYIHGVAVNPMQWIR